MAFLDVVVPPNHPKFDDFRINTYVVNCLTYLMILKPLFFLMVPDRSNTQD